MVIAVKRLNKLPEVWVFTKKIERLCPFYMIEAVVKKAKQYDKKIYSFTNICEYYRFDKKLMKKLRSHMSTVHICRKTDLEN